MEATSPCEEPNSGERPAEGWGGSGWETDAPHNPGTNRTYDVIAEGENPAGDPRGTVLYYQRFSAGSIFNVGSVNFGQSLLADSYAPAGERRLSTVIENVLSRFASASFTDFTGDGQPDVLAVDHSGNLHLYTGAGNGKFVENGGPVIDTGWEAYETIIPAGEFDETGRQALLAKTPSGELYLYHENGKGGLEAGGTKINSGDLWLYRGNGKGNLYEGRTLVSNKFAGYTYIISVRDFAGIASTDLLARDESGNMHLWAGDGHGHFITGTGETIDTGWNKYDLIVPGGDFAGDGTDDVIAREGETLYLYRSNSSGTGFVPGRSTLASGWGGFTTVIGQW
jgi:hypothetical protein